jgi:hypothetical protein
MVIHRKQEGIKDGHNMKTLDRIAYLTFKHAFHNTGQVH